MKLELVDVAPLRFEGGPAESGEYLLSPYVFAQGREIAIRAVPRIDDEPRLKISRIFRGRSIDGDLFALENTPVIAPGGDDIDRGGVEDPTVVDEGQRLDIFYSGWNPVAKHSTLMRARGTRAGGFAVCGAVFGGGEPQAKEATLVRVDTGWAMFFEVERDASLCGVARAPFIEGPWTIGEDVLTPRRDGFDSHNVSPVAFVRAPTGERVLIYNGSDASARWEIGWCALDEGCTRIIARCDQPIVRATRNAPDQRELVFGSSVVERDDGLDLYYSVADTDSTRATLRWRA